MRELKLQQSLSVDYGPYQSAGLCADVEELDMAAALVFSAHDAGHSVQLFAPKNTLLGLETSMFPWSGSCCTLSPLF